MLIEYLVYARCYVRHRGKICPKLQYRPSSSSQPSGGGRWHKSSEYRAIARDRMLLPGGSEGLEVHLWVCWPRVRVSLACSGMERLALLDYFTGSAPCSALESRGRKGWPWMLPPIQGTDWAPARLRDRWSNMSLLLQNQWIGISVALSFGCVIFGK